MLLISLKYNQQLLFNRAYIVNPDNYPLFFIMCNAQ